MSLNLYIYRAKVTKVYDGDTCTADIDLGMKTWVHSETLRLNRINTPELRGSEREAGLVARDRLRELILDKEIFLQTIKDKTGKYGRYLAEIWVIDENGGFVNINDQLIAEGLAEYYMTNSTEPLASPV